jgi:hypothetical protein
MRLRHFLSELRSLLSDLKMLGIVLVCAVAFYLWFLTLFTLFFVNALYAFCWLPLPLIVGVAVRSRIREIQKENPRLRRQKGNAQRRERFDT